MLFRSFVTNDKIEEKLANRANPSFWDMQDNLMALRRICGLMKLPWTADYLKITGELDVDLRSNIAAEAPDSQVVETPASPAPAHP